MQTCFCCETQPSVYVCNTCQEDLCPACSFQDVHYPKVSFCIVCFADFRGNLMYNVKIKSLCCLDAYEESQ